MPLLSPIENGAKFSWMGWRQVRPELSQLFGKDFIWSDGRLAYARFGMKGHNGLDFKCKVGTPIFAPCDGKIRVRDDGRHGYGLHIKIRSKHGAREIVLGHLSKAKVLDGSFVNAGDLLGYTGNTGFSSGAHLHFGLRFLIPSPGDIFKWQIQNYGNGYLGYINPVNALITFKGGLFKTSLL